MKRSERHWGANPLTILYICFAFAFAFALALFSIWETTQNNIYEILNRSILIG